MRGSSVTPWLATVCANDAAASGDNFRDNVEQVVIADPSAGDHIVTVSHKSSLTGGSQDFSLIATGGVRRRVWHIYADGSGDHNPIHVDPDFAKGVGLPGIILQGLCTMAFNFKAVQDEVAGGDPLR